MLVHKYGCEKGEVKDYGEKVLNGGNICLLFGKVRVSVGRNGLESLIFDR